jgi:hypothetical protein
VQDAQALVCSWRWRATCSSMPCWTWSPATTATRQGMTARRVAVRRPVQQGHLPQNGTRPDLGHRPAVTQHQQHPVEQQEQPAARRPCSTRSSPAWSRTNRGWEPTITAKVSPLGYLAVYVLALAPRHVRSRRRPDRDPRESAEALLGQLDQLCGTEAMAQLTAPSRADDERFGRWFAKLLRSTASPRAAQAFARHVGDRRAPASPADPRADAGAASHRQPTRSDRARPLPCRTHPRRQADRAARLRRAASLADRHRT